MTILDDQILDFCRRVVEESDSKNIDHFHYFGDLDYGKTWGRTFSVNRDSDTIGRSNWDTITEDLEERFPDDVQIERASHWACGWIDYLAVRMLNEDGTPTEAAIAVHEWREQLDEYPVANDERLSELEWNEAYETLEWCYGSYADSDDPEWPGKLMSWLLDHDAYYECDGSGVYWTAYDYKVRKEVIENLVLEGLLALGILETEYAYELLVPRYFTFERGMM